MDPPARARRAPSGQVGAVGLWLEGGGVSERVVGGAKPQIRAAVGGVYEETAGGKLISSEETVLEFCLDLSSGSKEDCVKGQPDI